MRAAWTGSGACTSGSTAPPRGATRRAAPGGATTTRTTSAEAVALSQRCVRASRGGRRWLGPAGCRQDDDEFRKAPRFRLHPQLALVLLHDDVVADRQAQAGALAGRLGSEEGG